MGALGNVWNLVTSSAGSMTSAILNSSPFGLFESAVVPQGSALDNAWDTVVNTASTVVGSTANAVSTDNLNKIVDGAKDAIAWCRDKWSNYKTWKTEGGWFNLGKKSGAGAVVATLVGSLIGARVLWKYVI